MFFIIQKWNLAESKTAKQTVLETDYNQLPNQLSNGLSLNDENLHLRIVGNISISKKGGAWRYLCLERSMIHFYTFHSLGFPTFHFKHEGQCLCCSGPEHVRTPKGPLSWLDPYVFPHYPSVSMQHYAHGKIYNARTFFLYRSPDIGIVWLVREALLSQIWLVSYVEWKQHLKGHCWGFDFKISYTFHIYL